MSIDKAFSFALCLLGASYVKETICRHKHCKHDDRISRRCSIHFRTAADRFPRPTHRGTTSRSVRVAALLFCFGLAVVSALATAVITVAIKSGITFAAVAGVIP